MDLDVNQLVGRTLAQAKELMTLRGYTMNYSKQSAMFDMTFRKVGAPSSFTISGWHGSSGRYGEDKAIFTLYETPTSTFSPTVALDVAGTDLPEQTKIAADLLAYLRSRA